MLLLLYAWFMTVYVSNLKRKNSSVDKLNEKRLGNKVNPDFIV